ncbi:MAG: hypothetical protein KUG81_04140 [Gammaproteobacteria bacterium]|nr:hypothetical protein [Gammaproteobacteria bacterium]
MNEIVELKNIEDNEFIESVVDKSDSFVSRIRVNFKNGYGLSIIRGHGSHGADEGLFEIAPVNKDDELDGRLFDAEHKGDSVLGHCDINILNHYINKIGTLVENGIEHKG